MKRLLGLLSVLTLAACLVACGSDGDGTGDGGSADGAQITGDGAAPATCQGQGPQLVRLTTDDGLSLAADLYLGGQAQGPAVVLLHMAPPANDRSNFPAALIDAMTGRGLTVLNVDRRGAGGSEGIAQEAYEGPNGKLDAKAAHDFLRAHACPVDPARIVYVGASNGSTTVVDFTLLSAAKAAIARPAAAVLLSGGTYTDNQTSILVHHALFSKIPLLFVYSAAEAAWNDGIKSKKALDWTFQQYEGADHGTALLTARPESIELIASFAATSTRQ